MKLSLPLLLLCFCTFSCQTKSLPQETMSSSAQPAAEEVKPMKIAFVGDVGIKDTSYATMKLIKNENADLLLVLGDYDYQHDPQGWEKMLDDTLGANFPILGVVGNHDVKNWPDYQKQWESRLSAHMPQVECSGDYGVKGTCTVNGILFVMSGIGTLGDDNGDRIKSALNSGNHIWKICAWHKNQSAMQVGDKEDAVGWPAYEQCREAGAIVATGHDHSYARSYLMGSFEKQDVVNHDDLLELSPGQSFIFVSGLGGESREKQYLAQSWWAKIYSKETGDAKNGALFCDFNVNNNPRQASCYFKNVNDEIIDQFGLESKLP